jgi:hypothetical protein
MEPAATEPTFPEPVLQVATWPDPVLDRLGHDPRSGYVEQYWLPVLGPSCLFLMRRLAAELEQRPDGFTIESTRWAQELGIGIKGGRHSPFWRSIERACRFGAARRSGPHLVVRRRLPPLTSRQVERLPETLRSAHAAWLAERLGQSRRATVARWAPTPPGEPAVAVRTPPAAPAGRPVGDHSHDDAA